jgi:hypothetical protein
VPSDQSDAFLQLPGDGAPIFGDAAIFQGRFFCRQKQHHVALGIEAGQGFQGNAAGFGVFKPAGKVRVENGGGLPVEQPQGVVDMA